MLSGVLCVCMYYERPLSPYVLSTSIHTHAHAHTHTHTHSGNVREREPRGRRERKRRADRRTNTQSSEKTNPDTSISAHQRILLSWERDYPLGHDATRAPVLYALDHMAEKLEAVKGTYINGQ